MNMANVRQRHFSRGITLVEMLVVLAVLSILAAIAIPTFAALGQSVSSDAQSTARTLYSTLRAARIYATTYHVDTAVVYSLDNYNAAGGNVLAPIHDSVANENVRVINAFAVAFKCPVNDRWLPVPSEDGQFSRFEGDSVLVLRSPEDMQVSLGSGTRDVALMETLYDDASAQFDPDMGELMMAVFGMTPVGIDFTSPPTCGLDANSANTIFFPAHVFTPRGSLVRSGTRQRFEVLVAPSVAEDLPERLQNPDVNSLISAGQSNLVTIPIELYQATGRIRIGS